MLSYSALTCSTLSSHILSAIMIICFRVKIGFSLSLSPTAAALALMALLEPAMAIVSMSIIGSGELGADTGDGGSRSWWDEGEPGGEEGPA